MKNSKYLTISFSIIVFLIGIVLIYQQKYLSALALIAIYLCYLLFLYLENKHYFKVDNFTKSLLMTTVTLHALLGECCSLYHNTIWFDKALHVFGTFSFSLFFYSIIDSAAIFDSNSKIFIFILIVSIGITTSAILESVEFIFDIVFKTKNQHGLVDTNLDMICNALGAVLAGFWLLYRKPS
ncbi:MAG: hypothetical protein MJA31_06770 [Clostridia bacterium]|nr:hypothetical protein [Clostridia bacterium]